MIDIDNREYMKQLTFKIIQMLHNEKKKRKIYPDFATRSNVVEYIKNKIDKAVKDLEEEGKIKSGELMNCGNRYYKITK